MNWDEEIDGRSDLSNEEKIGAKFWGKQCLEAMVEAADKAEKDGMSPAEAALHGWRSGYIYHVLESEGLIEEDDEPTGDSDAV